MGDTTGRKKAGLLRHDRMIVANELRSALSSWSDRLIALAALLGALVALKSALSHRPFIFAATAVATLATAAGVWAARMIERRVDFHSQDGVLAADALAEDARRHYALAIHALVCAIVTICAVIGRPAAAALAPIGYLVGAGVVPRRVPSGAHRRVIARVIAPSSNQASAATADLRSLGHNLRRSAHAAAQIDRTRPDGGRHRGDQRGGRPPAHHAGLQCRPLHDGVRLHGRADHRHPRSVRF